jgi:hypothetical protein
MSAIKPAAIRDKDNAPIPKIFVLKVRLNAISHAIGLPYVNRGQIVFLIANKDVNASPKKLGTLANLGPFRAGKDNP